MPNNDDPFQEFGGTQVDSGDDPFAEFGGEELKKKEISSNASKAGSLFGGQVGASNGSSIGNGQTIFDKPFLDRDIERGFDVSLSNPDLHKPKDGSLLRNDYYQKRKQEFEAKKAATTYQVKSSPQALAEYNKKRHKEIDEQISLAEQKKELYRDHSNQESTGTFDITDPKKYKELEDEQGELQGYKEQLKQNVAYEAANQIIPKYLDSPQDFNPTEVGKEILKIADPSAAREIETVESAGLVLPGIKKAELDRYGLEIGKQALQNHKDHPNYNSLIQNVEQQLNDFDETNFELTGNRVREKLGDVLRKEGKQAFFGFGYDTEDLKAAAAKANLSPAEQKVFDTYVLPLEQKVIGTQIPTGGFTKSLYNAVEKANVGTINTIGSLTGNRSDADRLSELMSDSEQKFRPNQNRTRWQKFVDGTGDLTGQVLNMALQSKGIGGVSKSLANPNVNLFITSYLNSYDSYRKNALQVMPDASELERNVYANFMASIEGLSEKIFNDQKILKAFSKEVAPSVADITKKFVSKEITKDVAQNQLASSIKTFGKQFAKAEIENATEESVVDVADDIAQSILGDKDFDLIKTGKKAANTAFTTMLHGGLVSGLAARGAQKSEQSQRAFQKATIVDMAKNPAPYLSSIEDLTLSGEITPEQAQEKTSIIKAAGEALQSIPEDAKQLDAPEIASYIIHKLNGDERSEGIAEGILMGTVEVNDDIEDTSPDKTLAKALDVKYVPQDVSRETSSVETQVPSAEESSTPTPIEQVSSESIVGDVVESETPIKDKWDERVATIDTEKEYKDLSELKEGDVILTKTGTLGFVKKVNPKKVIIETSYGGMGNNDIRLMELSVNKDEISVFKKPKTTTNEQPTEANSTANEGGITENGQEGTGQPDTGLPIDNRTGGENAGNQGNGAPPSGGGVEGGSKFEDADGRRFTKQMLRDEDILPKEEIAKTLEYAKQTNAMSIAEASDLLKKVGVDEAQNLVMNDTELKGAVRVTLAQVVIKKYNELAKQAMEAGSEAHRDYYLDKTIQTATYVTEKLATEPGQMIQAFSLWSRLSPEGQLRAANQDMAKQGKEKLRRRKKDIDTIGKKFQKANEETADEITKPENIKKATDKTESQRVKKAKDKIENAKKKRDAIIKKYKNDKGRNLFSSPVGLTTEGIEFVGDLAKTYIQEGVAKLEIVADKILQHLKEVSGKSPNELVRKNVYDIVREQVETHQGAEIKKGLSELEKDIAKIVKEHYTVTEEAKKKLVDKFVEKIGLEQDEAASLATEIETEFDKIATRKKRNILYNEKARFDKIQSSLGKKSEGKTVQDDLIKYSNLGAFENSDFADMIANKFGIKELTPEQAAKMIELAEKVQKAPEGSPKNDATEDLLAYRANLRGNDLMEVAQSAWYANILSGPHTHKKNIVSTFFNTVGELGAEMAKDPKAIPHIMYGYFNGVTKRGTVEFLHTFNTGRSPIHIKKIETPNALERKQFKGGAANPGNWFKYVMRLMVGEDVLSFQGLKEARAWQLARKEAAAQGVNTWSKAGIKKINEILFNTKDRYDAAHEQVMSEGLSDTKGKLSNEGKRRLYELMENSRPLEMTEDAYSFAAHGTFNYESTGTLGAITNAIAKALDSVNVGGAKPLRFIVPFTRIITNVVNNSLDFTPVGLIRAARGVRGFRSFEGSPITKSAFKELTRDERQRLIAKASIGIALAATFQALHEAGILQITGGGSDDEKKNAQLREMGWQEYSVKIGNTWYSYKYTPLTFMFGLLGNMNDASKYDNKESVLKRVEIAALRMGNQVADMTWINSASTFLGSLTENKASAAEKGLNKSLASTARGFVPFAGAIQQGSQIIQEGFDIPQKQVTNAWQTLIQDIPIARNSMNDKINALGEPVVRDTDIFFSTEKKDPVWKFLNEKQGWVAPVYKNSLFIFDQNTKEDRPATDDEYYEFSKLRGQIIKGGVAALMEKGYYLDENKVTKAKDLTPGQLNTILTKIEASATKKAKEKLFGIKEPDEELEGTEKIITELNKELYPDEEN